MPSMLGNKVRVQIFGQSHSAGLGAVIDGLPAGEKIDMERAVRFLQRRAGGGSTYTTPRKEADEPRVISGLVNGITCGAPLCVLFENANTVKSDYEYLKDTPRPSHADYTAAVKYGGNNDFSGGGHFSGRLTLPLCFAGALCLQLLERRGIYVGAHIYSIADVEDTPFNPLNVSAEDFERAENGFPVLNTTVAEQMIRTVEKAAAEQDSVGGVIEGAVTGLEVGIGSPLFDTVEGRLSYALFGIPAVKGVEFGAGFGISRMRGSEANDPFYIENGKVQTVTNNCGGILGGITNGMPLIFRAAFKPTPSIGKSQQTINLKTKEKAEIRIRGRHDPCVVPRAVPAVIAVTAITIFDMLLENQTAQGSSASK